MLGCLYSGITGMDAAAESMNVIGNNIANVNTCAFKSGTISFASVFAESVSILGNQPGNEEGKGVQVVALNSVWEQGALESTMNSTDLSITGEGFFRVDEAITSSEEEIYFTRAGQFTWDDEYYLIDYAGRRVQGYMCWDSSSETAITDPTAWTIGDIQIDPAMFNNCMDIQMSTNGSITAVHTSGGVEELVDLYQIALYTFPNNEGLRKVTGNLYQETNSSGPPSDNIPGENDSGKVNNNHLEMSNVDLAREFVDLIISQRAFQANSRVIGSSSEMLQEIINIMR